MTKKVQIPENELSIGLVSSRYELSSFDSKDEDLNTFLKNDALEQQEELFGKTYLCFYKDLVAGYMTLAADSLTVKSITQESERTGEYPAYPCILIGRLAVHHKLRKRGIGKYLMKLAIGIAMYGPVGCRYLSVDPKEKSMDYYKDKIGFKLLTSRKRLYLKVREAAKQTMPQESSINLWTDDKKEDAQAD